jgi:hypothetical protein
LDSPRAFPDEFAVPGSVQKNEPRNYTKKHEKMPIAPKASNSIATGAGPRFEKTARTVLSRSSKNQIQGEQKMGAHDTEHLKAAAAAASNGRTSSLPPTIQQKFEAAFGADFSAVKLHESHAPTLIGAKAFTVGNDIHFGPGACDPLTDSGQHLIAHELVHVVQQGGAQAAPSSAEAAPSVAESISSAAAE